ncbi:MAG TPA: hypothetical protein VF735_01355 [Pyrinomonadaceae bacterium]
MKIRRSTALKMTLATFALLLAAACGKGTVSNSNGGGTASNTNASNTRPASTASTPAATTADSLSTPTNAFKVFYETSKNKDVAGFKRTLSKDTLALLETQAKAENKTLDAALAEQFQKMEVPATLPESRNEKIEGDRATLEVKDDKTGQWESFKFVKENNEWKAQLGE